MPTEIVMPKLGESVVEGTVSKWLVGEGDSVQQFDPILEVTTDKVNTEIPASTSGTVLKLLIAEGITVQAGTLLGWIGEVGEILPTAPTAPSRPAQKPAAAPPAQAASARSLKKGAFISPVVARLTAEYDIDLGQVEGTGHGGRITKKDITHFANQSAVATPAGGAEQPLTPMRQAIAEHMVRSKHTSAHVTTVFEVNMSAVLAHQSENKDQFAEDGVELTLTAYFVVASAAALQAHTIVNSALLEDKIVLKEAVNIGVAVSLGEEGLIVPVIKNAAGKPLTETARKLNDLVARARARQLQPDEVQDGTFTITNHGVSGSLLATAIINQPQCAIMGVGAIQQRPVVKQDAVVARPMAYLTLTFDHRIIDGAIADTFLAKVKAVLENWI